MSRHPRRLRACASGAQAPPDGSAWVDYRALPRGHLGGRAWVGRAWVGRARVGRSLERRDCLTIALLAGLLLFAGTFGAYTCPRTGSDAASTIAFTSAVAPLDRNSSTDVSDLNVQYGTRIKLVNRLATDGAVATGTVATGTVATGTVATFATAVHFVADTEPPKPTNGKSGRLLAIIAAICVLGVTAAIIRAILAQRASGMVGT